MLKIHFAFLRCLFSTVACMTKSRRLRGCSGEQMISSVLLVNLKAWETEEERPHFPAFLWFVLRLRTWKKLDFQLVCHGTECWMKMTCFLWQGEILIWRAYKDEALHHETDSVQKLLITVQTSYIERPFQASNPSQNCCERKLTVPDKLDNHIFMINYSYIYNMIHIYIYIYLYVYIYIKRSPRIFLRWYPDLTGKCHAGRLASLLQPSRRS